MPTKEELKILQALPLELKILKTKERIKEWVERFGEDGVVVSLSGGKDSTVLLHIVRELYPNVKAVFSDTGLEYPQIRKFVKTIPNVDWVKPDMNFKEVVRTYGYPMFGKETAEAIWYARKIRGGASTPHFRQRAFGSSATEWGVQTRTELPTVFQGQPRQESLCQTNCRRKKIQGKLLGGGTTFTENGNALFRWATGREQVNFQ